MDKYASRGDPEGPIRTGPRRRARVSKPATGRRLSSPDPCRFRELAEEWLRAQTHLRPGSRQLYATSLRRHLFPRIGDERLDAIDVNAVAAIVADLEQDGLSGYTIRSILVPLNRVLNLAIRRGQISVNPLLQLERHERPRLPRREMRILSREELPQLLAATPPRYRPLIASAVFSGLRQSELLGLRWCDLSFDAGLIHVRGQLTRAGTYGPPKTERAFRDVILIPSLAASLNEHRRSLRRADAGDPVFATRSGKPLDHGQSWRALARAAEKASINRPGAPRLRFHDLRHTFASLLISEGLNVLFISRQLGHSAPSMTLDVYGGLFDRAAHARRAVDSLEAAFTFGGQATTTATGAARR